jgi:hypothetical protein
MTITNYTEDNEENKYKRYTHSCTPGTYGEQAVYNNERRSQWVKRCWGRACRGVCAHSPSEYKAATRNDKELVRVTNLQRKPLSILK